jgi:tetratricopeptide (TPR) repeat protein
MAHALRCLAIFAFCLGLVGMADDVLAGGGRSFTAQAATNYLHAAAVPMQAGDLEKAAAILEEGLERSLATPEMLTLLAEVYLRQGRLNEASLAAEEALGMDELYAPAYVQQGDVFMELGWLESAEESYRAALAVDDQIAIARHRLVQCLAESGRLQVAERECRAFLAADESAVLCLALGRILEGQGRFQEALAAYDRAVALDQRYAEAQASRAELFCMLGDYEAAATASHAALEIDPDCAAAHAALGLASAYNEDFMGAYSHAVKAEQAGLDMSAVWSLLQRQN